MYTIWLNRNFTDTQTGEEVEMDPLFLELAYNSYWDALEALNKLKEVYGGKIFIDQAQEYQARMGRY
jgi:hypothetical protein